MNDTIEGTAVAVKDGPAAGGAVAIRDKGGAPGIAWTPTFAVAVDDAVERKQQKRRFFSEVMDKDLHYGAIPGTGTKPTLLKPGAEMLLANMGLNPVFVDADKPTVVFAGPDHPESYIRYRRICRIYRQLGTREDERMIVAQAEGVCSSFEPKYRYRNDRLKCAVCGKPTIIKQKDFSNQGRDLGWICWKKEGKSDGCNEKYLPGDERITKQVVGKVNNPDVAELENTILKMADKRALVAATLIATGCSDIFTQDVEDTAPAPDADDLLPDPDPAPAAARPKPAAAKPRVVKPIATAVAFPHDDQCERVENERQATALPHADADDAGNSFDLAMANGWIDEHGNVLCGCPRRAAVAAAAKPVVSDARKALLQRVFQVNDVALEAGVAVPAAELRRVGASIQEVLGLAQPKKVTGYTDDELEAYLYRRAQAASQQPAAADPAPRKALDADMQAEVQKAIDASGIDATGLADFVLEVSDTNETLGNTYDWTMLTAMEALRLRDRLVTMAAPA